MTRRNTPCNECRRHRRKCVRSSVMEICSRCERLNKDCYNSDISDYSSESEHDVGNINTQVEQLNAMIADLERQINSLQFSRNELGSTSLIIDPSVQRNHQHSSSSSRAWKLTINNGEFQIETGIRNITDLLLTQPISYLSPLSRESDDQGNSELVMYFDSEKFISLVPLTMKVMDECTKTGLTKESLTVSTSLLLDSRSITDELLEIYFNCHNTFKPMIHQATFLKHYNQCRSPLDSLLCLCICAYVCTIPCEHTANDVYELRDMGDYFYTLAKSKLMDQFDEPDKRLENIICISFLTDYMHITLKLADCRSFANLAYQICFDLKNECSKPPKNNGDLIDQALFRRHFNIIMEMNQMMNYVANKSLDMMTFERLFWTCLPDESPETVDLVTAQNRIYRLYNHPLVNNIRSQIYRLHLGAMCSLSFESIVHLDEIMNEWWKEIPKKYYLCDDWLNLELCKEKIDESTTNVPLILFTNFLLFAMDIYSCLLQPKALNSNETQLLSIVQELTLNRSLHCCQLILHCNKKLATSKSLAPCHYILGVSEYLFHTVDVLVMLTLSSNLTIRAKANVMLKHCLSEIDGVKYMELHKVDPKDSPLRASMNGKVFNSIDLSFYKKYPRPWFAMIYDACHCLAEP